jgi:hypothetical protein
MCLNKINLKVRAESNHSIILKAYFHPLFHMILSTKPEKSNFYSFHIAILHIHFYLCLYPQLRNFIVTRNTRQPFISFLLE